MMHMYIFSCQENSYFECCHVIVFYGSIWKATVFEIGNVFLTCFDLNGQCIVCQKKYMMASDGLMHSIYKIARTFFSSETMGKFQSGSSPFQLIVILNLSCSIFLRATLPVIAQARVWVSVSSLHLLLWHFASFFSHMPILKYPTKHVPPTCVFVLGGDMYPCSRGGCSFPESLTTSYSDFKEHCL